MSHLHLDKVEDLFLALCISDLIKLLRQAAQHSAATGLIDRRVCACIRTLVHDGVVAGNAQPVVQPAEQLL